MDSLLASYASDEDSDKELPGDKTEKESISSKSVTAASIKDGLKSEENGSVRVGLFSRLPPVNSKVIENSSLVSNYSFTKHQHSSVSEFVVNAESISKKTFTKNESSKSNPSSSIFSALPQPKRNATSVSVNKKKTISFKPPIDMSILNQPEDEDDEPIKKKIKTTVGTTPSGILSFLPAPKNTLGSAPPLGSGLGSSARRISLTESSSPAMSASFSSSITTSFKESNEGRDGLQTIHNTDIDSSIPLPIHSSESLNNAQTSYPTSATSDQYSFYQQTSEQYDSSVDGHGLNHHQVLDSSAMYQETDNTYYADYGNYASFDQGNDYGGKEDPLQKVMAAEKRHGKAVTTNFVEIKQSDLTRKGNLREDQVKSTGIAFGPSYQPVSAGKDKPSKAHKRKHQIGSLYYDMKQKEMESLERRSRGMLTKSETQAKYGW